MNVLGSTPTQHVVAMLRAAAPQRAVGVLLSMPRERIDRLLAEMDGLLLARMLIAAEPARRTSLLSHLDDARLAAELALLPMAEAAAVMAALPPARVTAQLDRVSSEQLAMLLDALPDSPRRRLLDAMDPLRLADLRRVGFERAVIESLRRTTVRLAWVPDEYGSNLFAGVMHRLFGLALTYVDEGPMPPAAVVSARRAFAHQQVHGVLVVTNAAPSREALTLAQDARPVGLLTLVVTWSRSDNDGVLARALVRLAG